MKKTITFILLLLTVGSYAQDKAKPVVTFGAFVDTYYMYDFNSPGGNSKSHPFTQPSRHNEFNVNIALIEAKLSGENVRGRLALQSGTSVQANYAAEQNNRELSQLIAEASAGYQIASGFWVDAGIYPAPYGFESWISRDNKTYTRSIVADYSPYYQTGIKASWQVSDEFSAGLNIINGWQNISETNSDKAVGITLGYAPLATISFIYNNFIGNEMPDSAEAATRFYNNLCTRINASDAFQIDLTTDYGMQNVAGESQSWMGAALIGRYIFSDKLSASLRGEYYKDEHQIILVTGTPYGFDGFGGSINFDVALMPQLLWRSEIRMLSANDPVFPSEDGFIDQTGFVVTSLALTL